MVQVVMKEPGKIEYRDVEKPVPKEDELVISVKRIGICGSDIHVFHGQQPLTVYPVIQGHEVGGIVNAVGLKVSEFLPGEKVTFIPQVTCGTCYPCTHGMYNICSSLKVMGFQIGGAAQEYFAIHKSKVLKIPENLSLDEAAMIEPTAVAVHALHKAGNVKDKNVLILGAGPIGNLVGQVAKGFGAQSVMITEVSNFRLDIAKKCGIDYVVNPHAYDLDNVIEKHFAPDRADVIFECVGTKLSLNQAIAQLEVLQSQHAPATLNAQ